VSEIGVVALLRHHKKRLAAALAWMAVLASCTSAYGALAGPALRALFGGPGLQWPVGMSAWLPAPPDVETLRRWLPVLIVAAAALKGVAFQRQEVGVARLGQAVVHDLRTTLHRRLMALPPDVALAFGAGDLHSRFTHDADAAERLFTVGVASMLRDGLQALALVALCIALDPLLAVLALGLYPIGFWPIAHFGRRLRRAAGRSHAERGALAAVIHEHLARLPLVQLSGAERVAGAELEAASAAASRALIRTAALRSAASPVAEVLGAAALAGTLLFAAARIRAGLLAPETVMSFFATLMLLYQPAKGLARAQAVVAPGLAALDRIGAVLALPDRLPAGGQGTPPPASAPSVSLRGVDVERGGRSVLRDFDLELAPGRITALVGPNGAGKTTVAWLVARLLDPRAGEVRVDGRALAALDVEAWRRSIGWVTQAPLLGRGTLRENVRFGAGERSDVELEAAAALAGLEPLLARLPQGWDTPLGDGGAGLSGGEQQRIALARALVRRPLLLVLDEPTAHLDEAAAATFRDTLVEVARGRTVLLITHDRALVERADRVVELTPAPARSAA
jgi:ABC-type multidrug transport system fused ATPase/permease subunit